MGLLAGRKVKRRGSPEVDLLLTAFNIPTRRQLVKKNEARSQGTGAPSAVVACHNKQTNAGQPPFVAKPPKAAIAKTSSNCTAKHCKTPKCQTSSESGLDSTSNTDSVASDTGSSPKRQSRKHRKKTSKRTQRGSKARQCLKKNAQHEDEDNEEDEEPDSSFDSDVQLLPTSRRPERKSSNKGRRVANVVPRSLMKTDATALHNTRTSMPKNVNHARHAKQFSPTPHSSDNSAWMPWAVPHQYYPTSTYLTRSPESGSSKLAPAYHQWNDIGLSTVLGNSALHQNPLRQSPAQNLHHQQRSLDAALAALAARPDDPQLKAQASGQNQQQGQKPLDGDHHASVRNDHDPAVLKSSAPIIAEQSGKRPEDRAVLQDKGLLHACAGCGCIRSRKYHEKHVIAPGKTKQPSLCENCRAKLHKTGVIGKLKRHVCFGCGIYRSRSFNNEHPGRPEDKLLVNYCVRCENEMGTSPSDNSHEESGSNTPQDALEESHDAASRLLESPELKHRSPLSASPILDGSSTPAYLPKRDHGASRRREGREPILETAFSNSYEQEQSRSQYRPPFMEDVTTPLLARPSSTFIHNETSQEVSSPYTPSVVSNGTRNTRLSSILRCKTFVQDGGLGMDSSSPTKSTTSSDLSEVGSGSVASSSKTVKFKNLVGVRRSRSPSESGFASNEETEEAIKPDDNTQPSRIGTYGCNPLMDECGRPLSTSERLGSFSSNASHPEAYDEYDDGMPRGLEDRYSQSTRDHTRGAFSGYGGAFSSDAGFKTKAWDWSDINGHSSPCTPKEPPEWYGERSHSVSNTEAGDSFSMPHSQRSDFSSYFNDAADKYEGMPSSPPPCPHADGPVDQQPSETTNDHSSPLSFASNSGAFAFFSTPGSSARGASDFYSSTTKQHASHFHSAAHDTIYDSEPIIEEADSTTSSPVRKPLLLEYGLDAIPVLDLDGKTIVNESPESEDTSSDEDSGRDFDVPCLLSTLVTDKSTC
ncbi:uncharacterized protein F5Z01DRAFT_692827 [Emericellopsis atlantica]|uniref:Uncharacterized protein n=1 Tax=Emericellopsis atlantica TaxID=2614577 RepID=A0A9P7ZUH3_9HYPO|nr:uncharacterized protein F5Z01DRAFT_692827 [Emericellopsis atlantica]KAG9257945.1 hypothetical protein F5Z01DRAFT_692827 [Emericellopsis atlantica]